jgi:hypothetical protein
MTEFFLCNNCDGEGHLCYRCHMPASQCECPDDGTEEPGDIAQCDRCDGNGEIECIDDGSEE